MSLSGLQMEHFFGLTPNAGAGDMPRKQALETVQNNIAWIKRNRDEIAGWLEASVALDSSDDRKQSHCN